METLETYKNFNRDKSFEELQYNTASAIAKLENLKFELDFLNILLDRAIFKPNIMNLYERLTAFKHEINTANKNTDTLLTALKSHAHHIQNKMECDDLACDTFFTRKHDEMEHQLFKHHSEINNLKFRLFQYLESVITD